MEQRYRDVILPVGAWQFALRNLELRMTFKNTTHRPSTVMKAITDWAVAGCCKSPIDYDPRSD